MQGLRSGCHGRASDLEAPAQPPDVGLFGPGSVTWRLHADPMLGIAGLRALMLQALHPRAAEAVSQHSTFREDVWGRLTRTTEFIGVTTYGTTAQALSAGAHVRAVHAAMGVGGPGAPGTATGWTSRSCWPGCTDCLVDSVVEVLRRSGGVALDDDDADRYVAEQVRAAALVGPRAGPGAARPGRPRWRPLRDVRPQLRVDQRWPARRSAT